MSTTTTATERPADKLAALGAEALANILVDMLAAAGASPEWNSETIEAVLQPAHEPLSDLGVPWVGDTGADYGDLRYWVKEADKRGVYNEVEICGTCDRFTEFEEEGCNCERIAELREEIQELRDTIGSNSHPDDFVSEREDLAANLAELAELDPQTPKEQ